MSSIVAFTIAFMIASLVASIIAFMVALMVTSKGASKGASKLALDGVMVFTADLYVGGTLLRKRKCCPFGQFKNGRMVCWPVNKSGHVVFNTDNAHMLAKLGSLDVGSGIFAGGVTLDIAIGYGTTMNIAEETFRGVICVGFGEGYMMVRVVCNDGTCRQEKYLLTPDLKSNIVFGEDFKWVSKDNIEPL
jgi:hypothetical protein